MIMLLEDDAVALEQFLGQLVFTIAHRQTKDQATALLGRLALARRGYPDYVTPDQKPKP